MWPKVFHVTTRWASMDDHVPLKGENLNGYNSMLVAHNDMKFITLDNSQWEEDDPRIEILISGDKIDRDFG